MGDKMSLSGRTFGRWLNQETANKMRAVCTRNLDMGRRKRWLGKLPIPAKAHPLVREFFCLINRERETLKGVSSRAGCDYGTIADWRRRRTPNLVTFIAALNAIGYDLRIVRMKRDDA